MKKLIFATLAAFVMVSTIGCSDKKDSKEAESPKPPAVSMTGTSWQGDLTFDVGGLISGYLSAQGFGIPSMVQQLLNGRMTATLEFTAAFYSDSEGLLESSLVIPDNLNTILNTIGTFIPGFDPSGITSMISSFNGGYEGEFTYIFNGSKGTMTVVRYDEEWGEEEYTTYSFTRNGSRLVLDLAVDPEDTYELEATLGTHTVTMEKI